MLPLQKSKYFANPKTNVAKQIIIVYPQEVINLLYIPLFYTTGNSINNRIEVSSVDIRLKPTLENALEKATERA